MFGRKSTKTAAKQSRRQESEPLATDGFRDEILGPVVDAYRASPATVDFQFVLAARLLQVRSERSGRQEDRDNHND